MATTVKVIKYVPVKSLDFPGWYEIPGYPQNCANRKGEILTKKTGNFTKGGDAGRYLKVKVYRGDDDFPTMQYVHELVCRAFNGPRQEGFIVSHKDSNKKNNLAANLEWDTQSNNVIIAYKWKRDQLAFRQVATEQMPAWASWSLEVKGGLSHFIDDSIKRILVSSSNVHSVGYDKKEEIMEVEFKNGSVYQYYDVPPQVYYDLFEAPSVGKYLNEVVKGKYRYSKID